MEDIIKRLSDDIAKEIISRPKFDLDEISRIIKFRVKESMLDILLENVEKEEVAYHKLLLQQSELRTGSKEYVELGYKLALAKRKKSVANRAVNNVRRETSFKLITNYIKDTYGENELKKVYEIIHEKGL